MPYDPSLFLPRLREASKAQNKTPERLLASIGLSPKRIIAIEVQGLFALDVYRLLQLADALGVSLDWLAGRSGKRDIAS